MKSKTSPVTGLQDKRVWRRILQPATYAFNTQKLIGGNLVVDPQIAQMNDLARIIELTARSPMSVGPLLSAEASQASAGSYWADNVFTWDSKSKAFHEPPLFMSNYRRYPEGYGLLVAPLSVTIDNTTIWNWLVFDPDRKQLDRIDPESTPKPSLDSEIESLLRLHDLPFTYRSDERTRDVYRDVVKGTLIDFDCTKNIHLNLWGYWLLDLRLFFAENAQDDIFAEMKRRLSESVVISNLLLNFYPDFTSDANLHTFGSEDFLPAHTSKNDLWQYEPLIAKRVVQLTGLGCGRSQLNQILSAAIHDIVTKNGGADYRKLYQEPVGVEPRFIPNGQDSGGWLPKEQLDADVLALFATNKLRFGYVEGAPYVFRDDKKNLTGLDHALGGLIVARIADKYGVKLEPDWVEVKSSGEADAVSGNFNVLYSSLSDNDFDVALSGQMILRGNNLPAGTDPEWSSATAMLFTSVTFTGKEGIDSADIVSLKEKTRDDLISVLAAKYPGADLSFFSVTNPGPSYHSTTNLVRDLNNELASGRDANRGVAAWVNGIVAESTGVMQFQRTHFTVGDSIASGYQTKSIPDFKGVYLNMPAVQTPTIWNDPDVGSATLLPLAAFTLRTR
jgi:hypothetical protein